MMIPLSIVVVTWNSEREIAGLLRSVREHLGGAAEVIVVDNDSTDGTLRAAEDTDRVIANDRNAGFGAANNQGVRAARHDAVVLLNPDTVLVDGSLAALGERALRERALCGPELLNEDGSRQPSAAAAPGGWEDALRVLVPGAAMPPALGRRCEPWRSDRGREVAWLSASCIAAPREILVRLGPFDERIHLYAEDLELGLRARRAGVRSLYLPDVARVVHLADRSSSQVLADAGVEASVRNRRRVLTWHHGRTRATADLVLQLGHHGTRVAAKRALGRDAYRDRLWLRAAMTVARRRAG